MYARLSIYENVDLILAERIKHWIEPSGVDPFGDLPGYRGSMTLVDRDNARLVGIGFYATAGQAREAEAMLSTMPDRVRAEVPEEIRPALEMQAESIGLTRSSTATEPAHVLDPELVWLAHEHEPMATPHRLRHHAQALSESSSGM